MGPDCELGAGAGPFPSPLGRGSTFLSKVTIFCISKLLTPIAMLEPEEI